MLLARWYRGWILAALALGAFLAARAIHGVPIRASVASRGVGVIAVAVVYLACWQFVIFTGAPRNAVGYFPSFATPTAICLAVGFGALLEQPPIWRGQRVTVAFLMVFFLVSPALSKPPTLPTAVSWENSSPRVVGLVAETLRHMIAPDARVFLFGPSQPLYMAALTPYLRQVTHLYTLTTMPDARIRRRSGLWGKDEIREWLTKDADYAVIARRELDAFRDEQNTPFGNNVDLIWSLLREHFELIATAGAPPVVYEVYKRRTVPARSG